MRSKSRTPPLHVPTNASPPGSTSSRWDTVLPASTSSRRQDARTPSPGGISTRSRLASTCSKTACSGKVSWATVLEETRKLPGVGIIPRSRSCSPTSGAAKRSGVSHDNRRRKNGRSPVVEKRWQARHRSGRSGNARHRSGHWEIREREEQLALLREEEERRTVCFLFLGVGGFFLSLPIFRHL